MVTSKLKWIWIVVGPVLGLVVGTMLPHSPLHAVATDRQENFAIATGHMDGENEGIFFLDMLTGDLKGAVVNPFRRNIGYVYQINVFKDLEVDASKNPKFLMVTGTLEMRPDGGNQYAQGVIYVAEVTTGKMVCYGMPFNKGVLTNSTVPVQATFVPIFKVPLREAVVRSN